MCLGFIKFADEKVDSINLSGPNTPKHFPITKTTGIFKIYSELKLINVVQATFQMWLVATLSDSAVLEYM